jgi:hypothetical protein
MKHQSLSVMFTRFLASAILLRLLASPFPLPPVNIANTLFTLFDGLAIIMLQSSAAILDAPWT